LALPQFLVTYSHTAPIGFSADGKSVGVICQDGKLRFYPTSIDDYYKMAGKILSGYEQN
jgi:hypothetical protein